MNTDKIFDIIIVGGSFAGLSAAMTLGRSLRHVLIIDAGKPCNQQTPHAHNFITQDGEAPATITAKVREQVLRYPTVSLLQNTVVKAQQKDGLFKIHTAAGEQFSAKKLLLATGIKDLMPPIPGFTECWGISALHCPYCHGYEVKEEHIAIMGNGDTGFELVKLIYNWSKNLTLFTNGKSTLTKLQSEKLAQYNVAVVEPAMMRIAHDRGYIKQLVLQDGTQHPTTALFARLDFVQHSDISTQLGCEHSITGHITTDELGKTSIHGLYAAGDNASPLRSIAMASATGQKAGAAINKALIEESF